MSLIGCVDTLTDTCISGWAADDADYARTVTVDVIVNSVIVHGLRCDIFRKDLLAAGIGDGRKAFHYDPSPLLTPGSNRLEVRFSGEETALENGRGHWVKPRAGRLSEPQRALIGALEAYHEFTPQDRICALGEAAFNFARSLLETSIPVREVTTGLAGAVNADVTVAWAGCTPVLEVLRTLQPSVRDSMNRPGMLAIAFAEGAEEDGQIRRAFRECGLPEPKLESIPAASGQPRTLLAIAKFAEAESPAAQAMPVLAHIHVPKCAGTSLRALLETYFGPRHLGLYVNDTYFVYREEALRSYLSQDRDIRGFSSHHVRTFPRWLAGREMLYITFLREPVQQFVSYMTHIQKHYAAITSESLLQAVPPEASRLTLREFARWLLTHAQDVPFRENHNVNFFSRHNAPGATDRFAAAKAALSDFFFVGITERMGESVTKLRELALAAGLDFPPGPITFENTSADYRDDLKWINPDDEVGSLLLRSVEKDRQLYDWATARFESVVR